MTSFAVTLLLLFSCPPSTVLTHREDLGSGMTPTLRMFLQNCCHFEEDERSGELKLRTTECQLNLSRDNLGCTLSQCVRTHSPSESERSSPTASDVAYRFTLPPELSTIGARALNFCNSSSSRSGTASEFGEAAIRKVAEVEQSSGAEQAIVDALSNYRNAAGKGRDQFRPDQSWKMRGEERNGSSDLPLNLSSTGGCKSLLSSLNFWGANIVIFANVTYIIPYFVVAVVYALTPDLRGRAYDKAVISYNLCQIVLNGILIGIGVSVLCQITIDDKVFVLFGLLIMFLTISSTFWLFAICFDLTLSITRFKWMPHHFGSSRHRQDHERKKFLIYAGCAWLGALLPTTLACVFELSPILAKDSPVRPNFHKFDASPNLSVVVYVATLPAITCLVNSLLFCYTTYRIVLIQRCTAKARASKTRAATQTTGSRAVRSETFPVPVPALAEQGESISVKKARTSYFLFLRLYLLMDAPWITSTLAAIYVDLWILKFLRMIQPVLMLFSILPRPMVTRILDLGRSCCRRSRTCRK